MPRIGLSQSSGNLQPLGRPGEAPNIVPLNEANPTLGTLDPPHPPGDPATLAGHLTSWTPHVDMAQTAALGYLHRQFENLPRLEVTDESGRVLGELERREFPIQ
jgi:hypothetical protein